MEILLIGDSIRMGYEPLAREMLAGSTDIPVWGPAENGGHTVNLLTYFHLWIQRRQPALVHINSGLHDLKTIYYGSRINMVSVEHYAANVRTLLTAIRQTTKAKIVWALTTPVQDEAHNQAHAQWQDFCRYDADAVGYNAAAARVCAELDVPVNDLYAVARGVDLPRIQTADGVHFNTEGSTLLAGAVARAVLAHLPPK